MVFNGARRIRLIEAISRLSFFVHDTIEAHGIFDERPVLALVGKSVGISLLLLERGRRVDQICTAAVGKIVLLKRTNQILEIPAKIQFSTHKHLKILEFLPSQIRGIQFVVFNF